jgi:hypothetical protein
MGFFKSAEQRRIEREMKVKQGLRRIEKSIREQEKFADEYVKNARRAKQIGDMGQYRQIRAALKKTAAVKKMLERQLLGIRNAMLVTKQMQGHAEFAKSMAAMSREIAEIFGTTDLVRSQEQWERAISQAQTMEERMQIFVESMEGLNEETAPEGAITDDEIDRLIDAEMQAAGKKEMGELDALSKEIERELNLEKNP